MAIRRSAQQDQLRLPFGPVRNSDLFSNHWLENRLPLEPEWSELRREARAALDVVERLWREQRERVEQYGDEQGLEQAFIQPLLAALGWKLKYQTLLQRRKPDYALFLDDASLDGALRAGRQAPEFWSFASVVADAKAWHISLDRPTRMDNRREYPPEQIEWYLDRSHRDYAILTNGRLWRLIPRALDPGQARFQTYLEINIPQLLDARLGSEGQQLTLADEQATFDDFFRFFLFFGPHGLRSIEDRTPLIERARRGSSEYALSIGEDLKERVFEALRLATEGFLTHEPNGLTPNVDLDLCREQSFVLLYRLLFIMYAEDRGLLPYRRNHLYTENRSLARHRDEIAETLDRISRGREARYPTGQSRIWEDVGSLFDLINRGHKRYGVPAYNGGLFDPEGHPFLADKVLPDEYFSRVIDQLGRATDATHPEHGLSRVDYRDLAIQHLGSIYEGLLELQPRFATEAMVVIRKPGQSRTGDKIVPASATLPAGWEATATRYNAGEVYLQTDKGERRSFGSYYTPDHIVSYIVQQTLGPLCSSIADELDEEIAEVERKRKCARGRNREALDSQLATLRQDFDDRVLRLSVLDPAMGSGHFLVRACRYLAEEIATNPYTGDQAADELLEDEPTLVFWKRHVVEQCIFGVDINPMAVELAKLALWLETVSSDAPLTFLDHHLGCGNSLFGARVTELGELPGAIALQQNVFKQQVEQRIPAFLDPLQRIRKIPSESTAQIKEKERLYRRAFQPMCQSFKAVADVWCSAFVAPVDTRVTPEQYAESIATLSKVPAFRRLVEQPWFAAASGHVRSKQVRAFHWELEFPEVFFDLTGRRVEAGFDAIIGNPPWGQAALLETLGQMSRYEPVADDHAECFMCLATDLLSATGRMGLVVPDTILSPAKSAIRRHMLAQARTTCCYNIGADWFTSAVRMSTVLWFAQGSGDGQHTYTFSSCVLPVALRRMTQAHSASLADAITQVERVVSTSECLEDPQTAVPLFGDSAGVHVIRRAFSQALTLQDLCEHARGVELNKAGEVFRCPHCGDWDAPPRRDSSGELRPKTCSHCGEQYTVDSGNGPRVLVTDVRRTGSQWKPYIDGDSIKRYSAGPLRRIDTSARGVNYKPSACYRSPKILIRQAGIGVNAILDLSGAYCPQSVYIYRVKGSYRAQGVDEHLLLSILCSRLFHLQVFMAFGEIDSSRAFAKLTHTRLSRLHVPNVTSSRHSAHLLERIRSAVRTLAAHGIDNNELEDWDIEVCWGSFLGLTMVDVEAVIRNFSHVHENDTVLSLFPGGVAGREDHWLNVWRQAATRCGVKL